MKAECVLESNNETQRKAIDLRVGRTADDRRDVPANG